MDALILSCSTGGGHNAAGVAIKEELEARGHHVVMIDPYELVSHKLAEEIGGVYVRMVQHSPKLFGVVYSLGSLVRRIPGKSPVYYANITVAKKLQEYLQKRPADIILMPHLYPAELITYLKNSGVQLPPTVFIATDYTCIPFTEETDCDYYVIPGEAQEEEFVKRGIPQEKILPFGIPVRASFESQMDKHEARKELGLEQHSHYVLLTGGSVGAGNIDRTIRVLLAGFKKNRIDGRVIVVCGNNDKLYERLAGMEEERLLLIHKTKQMSLYMKACDLFISKPGGLSSTEAAVAQVPYIHITPIPGCESKNMRYFSKNGMCVAVRHPAIGLARAVELLGDPDSIEQMQANQRIGVPQDARVQICDWIEENAKCRKESSEH
jgi:processive 1,2-diacylglycerol beta-glucosyltransferase